MQGKGKIKVPKTTTLDKNYSKWIRERDGECVKCGSTERLECSHFKDRHIFPLRFHPDNMDTLCHWCHQEWEDMKEHDYRDFKFEQLGEKRFYKLAEIQKDYKANRNHKSAFEIRKEAAKFLKENKHEYGEPII